MHATSTWARGPTLDAGPTTARALRSRSTANLLRMGHCAPAVMQTLLDASGAEAPSLVKVAAGLPGGIGNTGGECGGLTAPLMLLGLRDGLEPEEDGLPRIVLKGRDLLERLERSQGSSACREIRGHARLPLRCIGVVREAPALCAQSLCNDCRGSVTAEQRQAYGLLHAHWARQDFHCAHAVIRRLEDKIRVEDYLLAASSAFMGGTVFAGRTCSALTAGVMALGLKLGEIENSRLRVLRMIATMAIGGDAFQDRLNAFNRTMNLGHDLARWFADEFGSTQCRAITQCDFSTTDGVRNYIDGGRQATCQTIAQRVAEKVARMIDSNAGRERAESA